MITGMPGAGKSVAVQVARQLQLPVFSMGDRVREEVRSRGLALSPDVVGQVASGERREKGADIWAQRTLALVPASTRVGVVDGARSAAEVEYFRKHAKARVMVLAIHSSPATRKARLLARRRSDDKRTRVGFEERDRRELGWGIGEAIAKADVMVVNERSLGEFQRDVARVLRPAAKPPTQRRDNRARPVRPRRARRERGKANTKRN